MPLLELLLDLLAGGKHRRLRRATAKLERTFQQAPQGGGQSLAVCASEYGKTMRLALRIDPAQAVLLLRSCDERIPPDCYEQTFSRPERDWLGRLARQTNLDTVTVVMELANRLHLDIICREAGDQLALLLARLGDANRLVSHFLQCQQFQVLTAKILAHGLGSPPMHASLERDLGLWSSFFASVPETMLPPIFAVHHLLGRGSDAVQLAATPRQQQAAMECCANSPHLQNVRAGLALAQQLADVPAQRRLQERAGDLLFADGRYEEALAEYRASDAAGKASECHERLGQPHEALAVCPAEQGERLVRLAGACLPLIDALVERHEFQEAARRTREVMTHLGRAAESTPALAERRAEAATLQAGVLAAGRHHFSRQAQQTVETAPIYLAWSRFEEQAGELARAAGRAEDSGDRYRAHQLYRQAGQFGDAVRVLEVDATPRGLISRAEARADGGDLTGAARLYEEAEQLDKAAQLFHQAGEFAAAARCLRGHLGDNAIEDPRLEEFLLRSGAIEELAGICIAAVQDKGRSTRAAGVLRRLLDQDRFVLPAAGATAARAALETMGMKGRRAFEERVQAWVAQARAEVDRRYAGIWGFDLGTTTCSAALYDTQTQQPVLCPWKGNSQFSSTLSVDEQGNELVGLAGEEIYSRGLIGHISAAKRKMGTGAVYRIRDRTYRPEEVAARLIGHARSIVEAFLMAQVRERISELARAALGESPPEDWLHWAEQHHDLRLSRPRAVVTIPAYFTNNQKHGTRDACTIAGIELQRLLHEPTAACLFAARNRRLSGRVVVVDLGAGTLDVSGLDVGEGVHEVEQVLGNNQYGGKDFDAVITTALQERLRQREGIEVGQSGQARQRLEIAAECLKVALSSQEHAHFVLYGFADGRDVRLELSQSDLAAMLSGQLETLRQTCQEFRAALKSRPDRLVLVGGPMLSPLVCRQIEEVFGMKKTAVDDPRTAVACGAALQGAVLDGKLSEIVLIDVTPLPLGIRVFNDKDKEEFSILVERNQTIPVERSQTYSTKEDNQTSVDVEIFQGEMSAGSRIGHFRLEGIRPAKKGEPKINVTFAIDVNCVLRVSARDEQTRQANSIRITDTTLLSPGERDAMAQRFREQQEQEQQRQLYRQQLQELAGQVEDALGGDTRALLQEWRSRLAAYQPSGTRLDPETQATLMEMFNRGTEMESELLLVEVPLRDLAAHAREYLQRTEKETAQPATPEAVQASLGEVRQLLARLREHLARLRPLRSRLAAWNAILVSQATEQTDPLRRFLACHEARDHARALEALAELPAPPDHLPHVLRHLDCLGQTGDIAGYRRILIQNRERLLVTPIDQTRTEVFLDRVRPALARIRLPLAEGGGQLAGFLVTDRLVATNQRALGRETDPGRVEVSVAGRANRVERIFLPRSPQVDVALLRLTETIEAVPFRLGYARLVEIGALVWAMCTDEPGKEENIPLLRSGVVNKFESFPEWNLQLLKLRLELPAWCSGGPVCNDLGEVVGVLTLREQRSERTTAEDCFALAIDVLEPLLQAAGASRCPG